MSEKERPQLIIDYEANTDKLVRLGDVVDQFKGKAIPAKAEPGEFAVINLSDMTSNGIAYDNLKTFSEERRHNSASSQRETSWFLHQILS